MLEPSHTSDIYRSLVHKCSDMISIINSKGNYTYINPSITSILGYEPEELIGKNAFAYFHPNDQEMALTAFRNIHINPVFYSPPFRYKAKSGDWVWVDMRASNLLDDPTVKGIVAVSRDISETMEAKLQLEESEAYYKSLFSYNPDAVFSLSPLGNIVEINDGFTKITGFGRDIIGRHYSVLMPPSFYTEAIKAFKKVQEGEACTLEGEILCSNGKPIYMSFTVIPIVVNSKIRGIQGIGKDITKQKKARDKIKEQAEKLKSIFESITQTFVVLDKDWRYTFINKAFTEATGQSAESLLGRCVWEVYPEAVGSQFYINCFKVARTGKSAHFDEYIPSLHITLEYNIYPFPGGVTVFMHDISKEKEIGRELQKLSLVASKTINGIVIMDAHGNVEWTNDGFTKLTGYTKEEVKGKRLSNVLQGPENNQETEKRIRDGYRQGIPFSEEVLNYKKNGEKFWMYFDITPIFDENGTLINFISVETDITELKKKEEEMEKLTTDLFVQNRDLQQFAYIVSHNLRAPVANILGLSGLLQNNDNHQQSTHALNMLLSSARQLDSVIKDLNNILSVRDGKHIGLTETIHIAEVLNQVIESQADIIQSSGSKVENLISPAFKTKATKAYVYSIFHNLLSNAIKYRAPDRGLHVTVSLEENADNTTILFQDNGIGMNLKDTNGQLFKLYKRFHSHVEGRGIGLYLVKEQAEAMGWQIQVESKPGEGTLFKLQIRNR